MSLIFSAADMLPKIRLFEYQEESMKGETIAAISTAVNSSGIGIVRISGDQAFEIADRVYRSPKGKKKLSEQQSHTTANIITLMQTVKWSPIPGSANAT